jgi:hypothetical protein
MRGRIETSIKNGALIMALSTTPEARKKHKMIARKMAGEFHRHGGACAMS